jgi:2-hydroxychromene-2-carboxylate isomerase
MARTVDFYFDYGSPNAYLAHRRLPAIAQRTGATVVPRIMLLGGVFKESGNHSPVEIAAKRPNAQNDLRRFANRHGVAFKPNPFFPINTLRLMRGAVAAEEGGYLAPYSEAAYRAMWVDARNMGDPAVARQTFAEAGLDADAIEQAIATEPVKERLKAATAAAVARGVFGAPTFFVGNEMFFGQDRLDFVEEALMGKSYL